MRIEATAIAGVLIVTPKRHGDARGFFAETYRQSALAEAGFDREFVQDNHAFSTRRGVVRGLHFQRPPHGQDKLLSVGRGAVYDVAVDIRPGSPTLGRHVGVELSAENGRQLLVPVGFAHGYQTLTDECDVFYKVTGTYAPQAEGGVLWSDPALAIAWPVPVQAATVNARDAAWPTLADFFGQGGFAPL